MEAPENITKETALSFRAKPELFIVGAVVILVVGISGWLVLSNNEVHHSETTKQLDVLDDAAVQMVEQLDRIIDHLEAE